MSRHPYATDLFLSLPPLSVLTGGGGKKEEEKITLVTSLVVHSVDGQPTTISLSPLASVIVTRSIRLAARNETFLGEKCHPRMLDARSASHGVVFKIFWTLEALSDDPRRMHHVDRFGERGCVLVCLWAIDSGDEKVERDWKSFNGSHYEKYLGRI